jgi:hypothetical protein
VTATVSKYVFVIYTVLMDHQSRIFGEAEENELRFKTFSCHDFICSGGYRE